jgi:hypothetical protein
MSTNSMKVGVQSASDGQGAPFRGTSEAALVTSDILGKYGELSSRGKLFVAANPAAKAVSVALTTTYTGLCVSNPAGSGKNLIMLGCQFAISVAEAAIATQHLIAGYSSAGVVTHTVALPSPGIQNCFINGTSGSVANADTEATIVSPLYLMPIRGGFTAGALGGPGTGNWIDLNGMFTIPPGGWIAFGALTAITGFGAFVWTERDA